MGTGCGVVGRKPVGASANASTCKASSQPPIKPTELVPVLSLGRLRWSPNTNVTPANGASVVSHLPFALWYPPMSAWRPYPQSACGRTSDVHPSSRINVEGSRYRQSCCPSVNSASWRLVPNVGGVGITYDNVRSRTRGARRVPWRRTSSHGQTGQEVAQRAAGQRGCPRRVPSPRPLLCNRPLWSVG